jgi:methyl-accepting chemotaxis protein
MSTAISIEERFNQGERNGEVIINGFRIALTLIYIFGLIAVSLVRHSIGYSYLPWRVHVGPAVFFAYSIVVFFYLRKRELLQSSFKYICVALDMVIISACLYVTNTYPEKYPPIVFLSIQAMFYMIFIALGGFRYNVRCAFFSGILSGILYLLIITIQRDVLAVTYTWFLNGKDIDVAFPLYNEIFRVTGMMAVGVITGMACKQHLILFNNMLKSESDAAAVAARTVVQTRTMAKTIQDSTNEIFVSSKDIFTTANNQAASVQEIESTINENAQIAADIAEKTGSVATIASKMEEDVLHGFSVLENNVNQMGDIKSKNDGVIAGIIALGNKITRIRDIVKTINTITDQTKVIAFNAALEAASAGDKGKRFAVVASEVNRLADDITAMTKQIKEQVEGIQDSSSSLIISSEESADKIADGLKLIKDLEDIFREIRSGAEITANQAQTITVSTQKQRQSTEQIDVAIADISKGLNNFIHSTEVATSSAEGLSRLIHELEILLNAKLDTDGDGGSIAGVSNI